MEITFELGKAIEHVRKHHPTLTYVMFGVDGRWLYMDGDMEAFTFDHRIETSILEEACDSIEVLPVVFLVK